ncbi:hypothetical protein [Catenulispora subtropica]|uniref:Uncharacterized protein n=1 Tax=Catenulispora subtropica TaxID=450798 RepID=A0ABN2THL8_9ACTN
MCGTRVQPTTDQAEVWILDDLKAPNSDSPDFARLGAALTTIAPDLGGLLPRELLETRQIVYLCQHHADAYHYPAHLPEP